MQISLGMYVVTVLVFLMITLISITKKKKPNAKIRQYLTNDELEQSGWDIVESIQQAGEEYVEKLNHIQKQANEQVAFLQKKEAVLQEIKKREQSIYSMLEEIREKEERMSDMYEDLKMTAKREEKQCMPSAVKVVSKKQEQEHEICRLYRKGKSVEEIVALTGEHKGYVEIKINMMDMKKNG